MTDEHARPLMTEAGFKQLREELATLKQRGRDEIAQRLREARAYGDGSNNDEHQAIIEDQMVLEARISALEDTLARAVIVDDGHEPDGVAVVGATVAIEDLASGEKSRHRLGVMGAGDRNVISVGSPMGKALMGAAPGTVVSVDLPNGRSRSVRVLEVESG